MLEMALEECQGKGEIWKRRIEIMEGLKREWIGFKTDPREDERIPTCGLDY